MCLWAASQGLRAQPSPAHLLQVCEGDGVAGEHLVRLVRQGRQQGELLPVRQVAAEHGQACATRESSQHQGHAKTWQHPEDGCCTPRHWHPQGRKGEHCCCTHSIQPSALPAAEDQRASSSPTEAALKQEQSHPAPHHLPQGLAEHRSPLSWPLLPALPWPFPVQAAPSPCSPRPGSPSTGRVHSPGHTPGTCQGTHTAGKGLWAPQGEVQVSPVLPGPVHVLVLLHALGIRC